MILIVEDEGNVRELLVRAVSRWFPSVEIVAAASAEEALAPLEQGQPCVLITDYLLPGLNGLDLAARARSSYPQLGIIVISALNLGSAPFKAGANTFLTKPLALADLRSAITNLA
jgi:CheY-like chemotaxis protein